MSTKSAIITKTIGKPITDEKDYLVIKDFSLETLKTFHREFRELNEDPEISVITIIINSYGGSVHALLGMLDVIDMAHKPVSTIAIGAAMSCGVILLSAGTKGLRFAGARADIMIHEVSSMEMGKLTELEANLVQTKRMNDMLMVELAKNAGKKDPKFFIKEMKKRTNLDWFVSAAEAKKLGIIDHVGVPEFITRKE